MASPSTSESFPGFSRLFVIGEAGDGGFRVDAQLPESQSNLALGLLRAEYRPQQPVTARWCMGRRRPSDIIYSTALFVRLISERMKELLERERVGGWTTYPVTLIGPQAEVIEGYSGLSISGRCGPITLGSNGIRMKQYPAGEYPVEVGISFEPQTWDGSDLFMSTESKGFVFASERVWRLLRKERIRGIGLVPLRDFETVPPA